MSRARPIEDLPPHLLDGRQVLIWEGDSATVCTWRRGAFEGWDSGFASEMDGEPIIIEDPTHFEELQAP